MTEHGALTRGQYGGQPEPVPCDRRVSDRIHATVKHVETAGGDPVCDRAPAQAEGNELCVRDDAVLSCRIGPDRPIHAPSTRFVAHSVYKRLLGGDAPLVQTEWR